MEVTFTYDGQTVRILESTCTDKPTEMWVSKRDLTNDEELPGATLTIQDMDGNIVESWVSTDTPHRVTGLHLGDAYTLTETRPADGYALADEITFRLLQKVDEDGSNLQEAEAYYLTKKSLLFWTWDDWKLLDDATVIMRDDTIKAEFSKKDLTTMEELPGAELTITDKDGKEIDRWVSSDKPHYIEKLPAGDYTLTEVKAPDGYAFAESVPFTALPTGEVQQFEMLDDVIKVEISKKDLTTMEELPGAELTLTDKGGTVVEHWTSTDKPHYIEKLPAGDYTLTEVKAPDGYAFAESVPFTVLPTGEVQRFEMLDDVIKVEISKVDITTNKELPGAELIITNKDGKVVEHWTSTDKPHYIEKLPAGEYTLTEITAPNGYEIAEDIPFTVSGELPEHKRFIYETAIPYFEKRGIPTRVLRGQKTYLDCFYHIVSRGNAEGKLASFPLTGRCSIQRDCKLPPIRKVSDDLCRQNQLSVIETDGRGISYGEWRNRREGKPTLRGMVKADVEMALAESSDFDDFVGKLQKMGYEVKYGPRVKHMAVRHQDSKRFVRLDGVAPQFSEAELRAFFTQLKKLPPEMQQEYQAENQPVQQSWQKEPELPVVRRVRCRSRLNRPYKKVGGIMACYYHYCALLRRNYRGRSGRRCYYLLREDFSKFNRYRRQCDLLWEQKIESTEELRTYKARLTHELEVLTQKRKYLYNHKEVLTPDVRNRRLEELSARMRTVRRELNTCTDIETDAAALLLKWQEVRQAEKEEREVNENEQRRRSR